MLLIFCAVATGTEQYQTTLPSFLAAAMSTASAANAGLAAAASVTAAPVSRLRRLIASIQLLRVAAVIQCVGSLAASKPAGQRRRMWYVGTCMHTLTHAARVAGLALSRNCLQE